mgnify:CR=1 FL=1
MDGQQAFTELPLNQLTKVFEQNEGKNTVIFDKTGNCGTFFGY